MNAAVLDNTTLRALYNLNLLDKLQLLYQEVWIPRQVEREFLQIEDIQEQTKRFTFISYFYNVHSSWFFPCNVYDQNDIDLFLADVPPTERRLHLGEVEAIVQHNRLPSANIEILLDDRKARKFLESKEILHHGTLYVLAHLSIKWQCCDYEASVKILIDNGQRFTIAKALKAFEAIHKEIL